jgi:glycosyl transferase family (putative galactosyltransferase)
MRSTSRRALATIGVGPMEPVLCQALRTFVPYAQRHGYEIRIGSGESDGRPAAWSKVLLLQRLLAEYDEVLWLDADLVILDQSEDLAASVPPASYQALVETRYEDQAWVNSGVWYLRSDERTARFLQAVWDSTEHIDHPWWENAPILELLGYDLDPRVPRRPTPWSEGTTILPEEWNRQMDTFDLRAKARIRHYAATSNTRREQWIRTDADRVTGNPTWVIGAGRRFAARHAPRAVPRSPADLMAKVRRRARVALHPPGG